MELTRANRRMIASLATVKGRREHRLFVAEGTKCVLETLGAFRLEALYATGDWIERHQASLPEGISPVETSRAYLVEMSSLSTPPDVMALYHIPVAKQAKPTADALSLALDRVQDPGNLGTIVRIASWMGITDIFCSPDTVDLYNPKTVQSTMGAIARVNVIYTPLATLLQEARREEVPVYGTFLDGENIYDTTLTSGGVIVMGNEGQGIGPEVEATVSHRLFIPSFPPGAPCVESLNVSVATAIATAEFRRRQYNN